MARTAAIAVAIFLLAGCAGRTGVSLLPGEIDALGAQNPTGAVVVLDPGSGTDIRVIDQANSQSGIRGGNVSVKAVSVAALEAKYGDLLAALPSQPKSFTLYFQQGSTELVDPSVIDAVLAEIKSRTGADIQIVGHTDTTGEGPLNDTVSEKRAEAVKALLIARGVDPAIARASGRGERELRIKTEDNVENAENRRVEVIVR